MVVDHTGIDLIAYDHSTDQRFSLTVKSRTRNIAKETTAINVFSSRKNDLQKLLDACKAFTCEPWIAIYVETADFTDVYLTSLENYDNKYRSKKGGVIHSWRMREKDTQRYDEDPSVKHIKIKFRATNWN